MAALVVVVNVHRTHVAYDYRLSSYLSGRSNFGPFHNRPGPCFHQERFCIFLMWPFSSSSYLAVVNAKRAQRTDALSAAPPPPKDSSEFLKATASEIVSRISKGEWTASQVVDAFIAQAANAHAATNCLTEVLFASAREQAQALDLEFATSKTVRGPFHGVPVSFKEQYDIVGVDTTLGFTEWANKPATTNADLVTRFIAAGAIIISKTNVPQTMFAFECCNPIWGRTLNPYNDDYTCGGSSGGEAALVAMDGTVIGIGSDIGGSLRIPSAYCGVYSLKPAFGRISYGGAQGPAPGFEGIKTVAGPISRSVEDLDAVARLVFGVPGSIPDIAPVPYREAKLPEVLRFGYYTSDSYVKASPACQRAVLQTVDALRRQGHECIEFKVPDVPHAFNIFVGLTSTDGYKTMLSHLGPDPKDSSLFISTLGPRLNWMVRAVLTWALETLLHDSTFAATMRASRVKPFSEYMQLIVQRNEYAKTFHQEVWLKHGFDAVVAPVQAVPQLPHGGCDKLSTMAVATILYNVLDLPVGCMPATHVDPVKDQVSEEWIKGPGHGSHLLESRIYHGKNPLYDPKKMQGMPVGIQVVGQKWGEEKILAMMKVIDNALGKERGFGPASCKRSREGVVG
ncbi:amidase [Infundibulicybe gibba]|nr:amidase [Infundibulicybe gibba]